VGTLEWEQKQRLRLLHQVAPAFERHRERDAAAFLELGDLEEADRYGVLLRTTPIATPVRGGYITSMALSSRKRATTIILDAKTDRLLDVVARAHGVSRSEFIRVQLRRALEQHRPHPRPRSAGIVKRRLPKRGDERELFRTLER
jgi:hypothetical protein